MFERNKIDNAPEAALVPVEIVMADGERLKGKLAVPAGRTLTDAINGAGSFIEFEPYGAERRFIAKTQMTSIQLVGVPRASALASRARPNEFDPHTILGLAPGASWDEVRQAYVQMTKLYHPDRYANAILPPEVKDYLDATVRRLNAAYAALETPHKISKVRTADRAAPIYTSAPR
mgnify:CR=1 FL=1